MAVGLWSRGAAIATIVLFDTVLLRNPVFWEGTEIVLRLFGVLLACSRCGAAWSVDAMLARRRGATEVGIPAWPRRLMMVQLALALASAGVLKRDPAWIEGDAVYWALQSTHYARFDTASGLEGLRSSVLPAATWFARTAETLFPLAMVGVIGRWSVRRFAPLEGHRRALVVLATAIFIATSTGFVAVTGEPRLLPVSSRETAAIVWFAVVGGSSVLWSIVRRPMPIDAGRLDPVRIGHRIFGRRIWIGAAVALFLAMWVLMNIGVFHPAMLAAMLVYAGDPASSGSHRGLAYGRWARRAGGLAIAIHLTSIAPVPLPASRTFAQLRRATRSTQSWGLWASPPRTNALLAATLVTRDGARIELAVDLEPGRRPSPWWYDRRWKIVGRVIATADRGPFASAYAAWLCRGAGELAQAIELRVRSVPIVSPDAREPTPRAISEPTVASLGRYACL